MPDWDSIETVLPNGEGRALDIGAGTGRHRLPIEQAGYKWSGCDYQGKPENNIIKADAHSLPFPDNVFDLVNIWQVMEYLHDPWKAMSEIQRVLKPGGIVIGSVSFLEPMQGHTYFYFSKNGLTTLLEKSGFTNIFLSPGIGCFPLICWTWMNQISGNCWLKKGALLSARIMVWTISIIFDILSAVKYSFGFGYNFKRQWLRETMPFNYAGQITFRAIKG
jgi:SAM-dependent methyltransferase